MGFIANMFNFLNRDFLNDLSSETVRNTKLDELIRKTEYSTIPHTPIDYSDLEITFLTELTALVESAKFDSSDLKLKRMSDTTLNVMYLERQVGRIRLQGDYTRMQILDFDDVFYLENEPFEVYMQSIRRWISYLKDLHNTLE